MCSLCPYNWTLHYLLGSLPLPMCLCLVISQFRRTGRKSDLPNQAQINGTRPTLKITYSRKVIHFEICLPQIPGHFLSLLQPTRNLTAISTIMVLWLGFKCYDCGHILVVCPVFFVVVNFTWFIFQIEMFWLLLFWPFIHSFHSKYKTYKWLLGSRGRWGLF